MKYLAIFSDLSFNLLICIIFALFVIPRGTQNEVLKTKPASLSKNKPKDEQVTLLLTKKGRYEKNGNLIIPLNDTVKLKNKKILVIISDYPNALEALIDLQTDLAVARVKAVAYTLQNKGG